MRVSPISWMFAQPRLSGEKKSLIPSPSLRPLHNLCWRGVGPLVLRLSKYERGDVRRSGRNNRCDLQLRKGLSMGEGEGDPCPAATVKQIPHYLGNTSRNPITVSSGAATVPSPPLSSMLLWSVSASMASSMLMSPCPAPSARVTVVITSML